MNDIAIKFHSFIKIKKRKKEVWSISRTFGQSFSDGSDGSDGRWGDNDELTANP
jgi:hypothetical protein